jgi:hypothetical protein
MVAQAQQQRVMHCADGQQPTLLKAQVGIHGLCRVWCVMKQQGNRLLYVQGSALPATSNTVRCCC